MYLESCHTSASSICTRANAISKCLQEHLYSACGQGFPESYGRIAQRVKRAREYWRTIVPHASVSSELVRALSCTNLIEVPVTKAYIVPKPCNDPPEKVPHKMEVGFLFVFCCLKQADEFTYLDLSPY